MSDPRVFKCMNCGMKGLCEDFTDISVDPSRMVVGAVLPNLQCSDCGALTLSGDPYTAEEIVCQVRDNVQSMATDSAMEAKEALILALLRCDSTQFDRLMWPYLDEIKRLCREEDHPTVDVVAMGMVIHWHALDV